LKGKLIISLAGVLVIFALSSSESYNCAKKINDEYEVKSAFLLNFSKFIEWQDQAKISLSTFRIAIYKHSPIEKPLEKLIANKKIDGKTIEILKFSNLDECPNAQIIFLPYITNFTDFKRIAKSEECKNSLIISENIGRLKIGSCINFLVLKNKIKFEINTTNLKENKLKASSHLLKLAEIIEE
jgi:hypothetical protein